MAFQDTHPTCPSPLRRLRGGFTLVELLVVIGIIAVLIAILMPVLNQAREHANTVKCLSNLRQIGLAAATYTSANKGCVLPADIDLGPPYVDPSFGRNWNDTWATLLVGQNHLPYPRNVPAASPPGLDNVFGCPSGILEMSQITHTSVNVPSSRKDARGSMGHLHQSAVLEPGLNVFVWYGINGTSGSLTPTDPVVDASTFVPCKRIIRIPGTSSTRGWTRIAQLRNASQLVFLFDGLLGLNYSATNANRINARHKRQTVTNVAFFDGHAESIMTKEIPGGDGDANAGGGPANTFSLVNCNRFRRVLWRMDQ